MNPIEHEIRMALPSPFTEHMDRQKMLRSLMESVHQLDWDKWDVLSDPAKQWVNEATDCANMRHPMPEFPASEPQAITETPYISPANPANAHQPT